MFDWLKDPAKQPWWVVVLLLDALLVVIPTLRIDRSEEGYTFATHPPTTLLPVGIGVFLMVAALRAVSTILRQPDSTIYCSDSMVRLSAVD